MRIAPWIVGVGLLSACDNPRAADCKLECTGGAACPSGLECAFGMCRHPELANEACGGDMPDMPVAIDMAVGEDMAVDMPDMPDPCTWANVASNFAPTDVDDPAPIAWDVTADETFMTGGVGGVALAQAGTGNLWLVHRSRFTVAAGATLTITGDHPLVIAADTIDIQGTIILRNGTNPTGCDATPGPNSCAAGPGGGGAGYGAVGGMGGGGIAGGTVTGVLAIPIRGGCNGAKGGDGRTGAGDLTPKVGGAGGIGGGAIQLSARTSLVVAGTITAPGQGGLPGTSDRVAGLACSGALGRASGGGGGGGGGTIALEACTTTVAATAKLCANGGGGGGGAGAGNTDTGIVGQPGSCDTQAGGGPGEVATANGGAGGFDGLPAGNGLRDQRGGGGGGGAVGRIHIRAVTGSPVTTGATIRPSANRSQ